MPPEVGRALQRGLVVSLPVAAVLVLRPGLLGLALRLWLVALGAVAIAALTGAALAGLPVGDGAGLRLRWGWWRRPPPERREALELVLLGILSDGHVLIEDFPGLAKTLIARSFAQVLRLGFKRIQFTPDLMPSDVTGSAIFSPRTSDFEFRPGPIFTNLLLA